MIGKPDLTSSSSAIRSPIARFGEDGQYHQDQRWCTYPGGKNGAGVYQRIINHMPPHRLYVEPFLGGGAIMRMKRPADCSIGVDADDDVLKEAKRWEIPCLELVHTNALEWLDRNSFPDDTLIYMDPPYLLSTRRQYRLIYRYELTDKDHEALLDIAKRLDCMVIISGYWSRLYEDELAGWRTDSFQTMTRGGSLATEWLWMNFDRPLELHDYRYLGDNFRQRERIKRKKNRWKRRLVEMPTLERYAILSALEELYGDRTTSGDDAEASSESAMGSGTQRQKRRWPRGDRQG